MLRKPDVTELLFTYRCIARIWNNLKGERLKILFSRYATWGIADLFRHKDGFFSRLIRVIMITLIHDFKARKKYLKT